MAPCVFDSGKVTTPPSTNTNMLAVSGSVAPAPTLPPSTGCPPSPTETPIIQQGPAVIKPVPCLESPGTPHTHPAPLPVQHHPRTPSSNAAVVGGALGAILGFAVVVRVVLVLRRQQQQQQHRMRVLSAEEEGVVEGGLREGPLEGSGKEDVGGFELQWTSIASLRAGGGLK